VHKCTPGCDGQYLFVVERRGEQQGPSHEPSDDAHDGVQLPQRPPEVDFSALLVVLAPIHQRADQKEQIGHYKQSESDLDIPVSFEV